MATREAAFVTGGASGIGLAVAEALARRGYSLTLLDLDAPGLASAAARLRALGGHGAPDVITIPGDVTDRETQAAAFRAHLERFGRLDVAVLNAGIGERGDFFAAGTSDAAHDKTLGIDLTAAIDGTRMAAACMSRGAPAAAAAGGGGGCIVAVASAAGIFPVPAAPIYAAAKGGLVHFMRSAAPRLADMGITAAAVCPQYVDTPLVQNMLRHAPETAKAMMGPLHGLPLLAPSRVAEVVMSCVDDHKTAGPVGVSLVAGAAAEGEGAAARKRRVLLEAGIGSVRLLLQSGDVVDPFAPRRRKEKGSGGGGSGKGPSAAAAAAAGAGAVTLEAARALARFSPDALRRFVAPGQLPGSYQKLQVAALSVDFRTATRTAEAPLPAPLPGGLPAGAVLVRRLFAGVNASDINYTSGRYHGTAAAAQRALPYDAGFESVGVVVAAAPGVQGLPPGTPVATMDAGFSEFGVAPANRVLRVPAPTPEVLALLTSGLTASIALEQSARLPLPLLGLSAAAANDGASAGAAGSGGRRKVVLVTAAAGGTGQFAVQLAKLAGCAVVATCGGDDKAALLRGLGADRVINYRREDVKAVLKAEYPRGIDIIYESVGGKMFDTCVDALAERGTLVVIGMMSAYSSGWKPSSHEGLAEKLLWKSASVTGFFLLRYAPLWGPHLSALVELVRQGRLRVAIDPTRFVGLESVPAAVDRLQSGSSSGKVVVQIPAQLPGEGPAGGDIIGGGGGGAASRL